MQIQDFCFHKLQKSVLLYNPKQLELWTDLFGLRIIMISFLNPLLLEQNQKTANAQSQYAQQNVEEKTNL